jgi:hypothetical protein
LLELGPQACELILLTQPDPLEPTGSSSNPAGDAQLSADTPFGCFGQQKLLVFSR